jgi:hypothetical protein
MAHVPPAAWVNRRVQKRQYNGWRVVSYRKLEAGSHASQRTAHLHFLVLRLTHVSHQVEVVLPSP